MVSTAYLSESVEEGERGFALSLYTISMNTGNFIGSYFLAYTLTLSGFRSMYIIAAIISSLSIPILLFLEHRYSGRR